MLNKKLITKVLKAALTTNADFAEVFIEDWTPPISTSTIVSPEIQHGLTPESRSSVQINPGSPEPEFWTTDQILSHSSFETSPRFRRTLLFRWAKGS